MSSLSAFAISPKSPNPVTCLEKYWLDYLDLPSSLFSISLFSIPSSCFWEDYYYHVYLYCNSFSSGIMTIFVAKGVDERERERGRRKYSRFTDIFTSRWQDKTWVQDVEEMKGNARETLSSVSWSPRKRQTCITSCEPCQTNLALKYFIDRDCKCDLSCVVKSANATGSKEESKEMIITRCLRLEKQAARGSHWNV